MPREPDQAYARMSDAAVPHWDMKIRHFHLRIFRIMPAMNSRFPL
jgi:hypothetical protein